MRKINDKGGCANCYYGDNCPDEKICEFYTPLNPYETICREYEEDLKERESVYAELIKEFGGDNY